MVRSEQQRGDRHHAYIQIQSAAAAVEEREEVATTVAESPPAQVGLMHRGSDVPSLAVVALPDRSDRWLNRFPIVSFVDGRG